MSWFYWYSLLVHLATNRSFEDEERIYVVLIKTKLTNTPLWYFYCQSSPTLTFVSLLTFHSVQHCYCHSHINQLHLPISPPLFIILSHHALGFAYFFLILVFPMSCYLSLSFSRIWTNMHTLICWALFTFTLLFPSQLPISALSVFSPPLSLSPTPTPNLCAQSFLLNAPVMAAWEMQPLNSVKWLAIDTKLNNIYQHQSLGRNSHPITLPTKITLNILSYDRKQTSNNNDDGKLVPYYLLFQKKSYILGVYHIYPSCDTIISILITMSFIFYYLHVLRQQANRKIVSISGTHGK